MSANAYEFAPDMRWVIETYGILIIDPHKGAYCSVPYPSAAVWDFLSRGYSPSKIGKMIRHIGSFTDTVTAENFVSDCLTTWANLGWLRMAARGDADV